jgi:hypothetical protein
MIANTRVVTQRTFTFIALAAACFVPAIVARSQSPIVFMTLSSTLNRFDNGIQTFAVGSGSFSGVNLLGGNVLVADYTSDRIQRFSPTGTLLSPFVLFDSPTYLETDNVGNVYATQIGGTTPIATATRFNSAGTITGTFQVPSTFSLGGVDADADGNTYIIKKSASAEIVKFDSAGTLLNSTPVLTGADDVSIDEVGKRMFIANETNSASSILIYDISGAAPVFTGSIAGPPGSVLVGVSYTPGSGNILAADFGLRTTGLDMPRGYEFSPSGVLLRTYIPTSAQFAFDIIAYQVPEPSTILCIAMALPGMAFVRRRRGSGKGR